MNHTWHPRHFRPFLAALVAGLLLGGCGDAQPDAEEPMETDSVADTATAAPAAPAREAPADDALLNPNDADRQTLVAVEGLDSAAVSIILDGRPFDDMLALHEALSARMDSAALDDLYRRVFIPLDLNSASEEEILLIPGVGPRMAHEFEEYRPYDGGMAEFRREIGKYVDDDEVARLERYVTIR
jgi:DNA uptake protein ComE-like DNA-binding protein